MRQVSFCYVKRLPREIPKLFNKKNSNPAVNKINRIKKATLDKDKCTINTHIQNTSMEKQNNQDELVQKYYPYLFAQKYGKYFLKTQKLIHIMLL